MKQRCFQIPALQISSSAMRMPRPHCHVILSCHKLQNTCNPESITDKSMCYAVQPEEYFHIDVTVSLWVIADVCELWQPSFWKKESLILMHLFQCICLFVSVGTLCKIHSNIPVFIVDSFSKDNTTKTTVDGVTHIHKSSLFSQLSQETPLYTQRCGSQLTANPFILTININGIMLTNTLAF